MVPLPGLTVTADRATAAPTVTLDRKGTKTQKQRTYLVLTTINDRTCGNMMIAIRKWMEMGILKDEAYGQGIIVPVAMTNSRKMHSMVRRSSPPLPLNRISLTHIHSYV
jgi:hypothetical protein